MHVLQLVSNWILTSCQPQRVTSVQLNSVISKCIFQNSSHISKPFRKTNPYKDTQSHHKNRSSVNNACVTVTPQESVVCKQCMCHSHTTITTGLWAMHVSQSHHKNHWSIHNACVAVSQQRSPVCTHACHNQISQSYHKNHSLSSNNPPSSTELLSVIMRQSFIFTFAQRHSVITQSLISPFIECHYLPSHSPPSSHSCIVTLSSNSLSSSCSHSVALCHHTVFILPQWVLSSHSHSSSQSHSVTPCHLTVITFTQRHSVVI